MRLLTREELMLVAGGNSSSEIVVTAPGGGGGGFGGGSWGGGGGSWGGGSGGGGGGGSGSEQLDIDTDCPAESSAADTAMDSLYANSATAKALIDSAAASGIKIEIISANVAGFGQQNSFENNTIYWDPFLYLTGTNSNGTEYSVAPIMTLAHELVHAGHANDPNYQHLSSETQVMQIANQIAGELNSSTGSSFDTSRDNHDGTRHNTTNVMSTNYSISRPGCG